MSPQRRRSQKHSYHRELKIREQECSTELNESIFDSRREPDLRSILHSRPRNYDCYDKIQNFTESHELEKLQKEWNDIRKIDTKNAAKISLISENNRKFEEFTREIAQQSRTNYDLIIGKNQMHDSYERKLTDMLTKFQHIKTHLSELSKEKSEIINLYETQLSGKFYICRLIQKFSPLTFLELITSFSYFQNKKRNWQKL